ASSGARKKAKPTQRDRKQQILPPQPNLPIHTPKPLSCRGFLRSRTEQYRWREDFIFAGNRRKREAFILHSEPLVSKRPEPGHIIASDDITATALYEVRRRCTM
ncbi:hypothetical protein, partial [Rhizobium leguminosarum]|uniref:hypothetical protein n=1 Tax=Rhizobium leguminosarum TaxID=384 RepID=UPI001C96631E